MMNLTFKLISSTAVISIFFFITGCGLTSTITISPQQEFVLGEVANRNFTAKVSNLSKNEVKVVIIDSETKAQTQGFGLPGKNDAKISVSKNETVIFRNPNANEVKVKAKLNKEVEGMRYQPVPSKRAKLLLKDSLLNDLNLLEQALTEMHPGLYRYNSPEQINSLFSELKNNLPAQLPEDEFMIRLAQTIRKVKCGHTYLNPWNMNRVLRERLFGGKIYFPLGFKVLDGRFFVIENATENSDIKKGAEIFAINGIQISEVYDSLKTIAKTDGNNSSPIDHYLSLWNYQKRNWHAFDLYFHLFFPVSDETFRVSFRNYEDNQIQSTTIPAMTKAEREEKMVQKYGKEVVERKDWSLDIVSDELAVIRLGTFAIWNWKDFDFKKWYADAFSTIDSLNIKKLAIDIRGNGGGLSEPADELLSYLISDTIKCNDLGKTLIRTTKFNPDLLPFIDTWVEPLKVGLPENMYKKSINGLFELLVPSECSDILPKENRFDGQIFIFGGSSNVSATFNLLEKANQFGFATFIGEESGGNQQGINGGEYAFFTMPYSKMEVDIPLKFFTPPSESEDAGIQPKVKIKMSQKDIATGNDPYLKYVQN